MIYLNHAGTSWPRLPSVLAAAGEAQTLAPEEWPTLLEQSRNEVASFLGVRHPERLLLTPGCTSALAVALGDLPWVAGDRVVTSGLEHHALARPIRGSLERLGVRHDVAPYAPGTPIDLDFVDARLREGRVRAVACTAASNVTGELLPVEELAALAHAHGAVAVVDAAQTAGVTPLDVERLGVDVLTFAGHKGLLGPQGIGGLYVAPGVELSSPAASCELGGDRSACSPFPSYCDVGSVNLAGAAGLAAGVRWLRDRGAAVRIPARQAAGRLLEGLASLPGITVYGSRDVDRRTLAVSFTSRDLSPAEIESRLLGEHGIVVRSGHHCAPQAHETIGTADQGTVRVSFGHDSREHDADAVLAALGALLER